MSSLSFLGARRMVAAAASASTRRKAAIPQNMLNSCRLATPASHRVRFITGDVLNPAKPEDKPSLKEINEQFKTLEKLLEEKFEFTGKSDGNDLKALLISNNTKFDTDKALKDVEAENPEFLKEVQKELAETNMKLAEVALSSAVNDEAMVDARLSRLKDLLQGKARLHSS